jgi:molecular chaperone GrpE
MNPENIENVNKEQQELQEEHFTQPVDTKDEESPEVTAKELTEQIANLATQIFQKEEENKQLSEKVKVAQAELVNYRKRKDEETATLLKYANADLILELIPAIDNFERAIKQATKSENSEIQKFMTGINLIYQNLQNTLTKFGVEVISRVGQEYDPKLEEALLTDCVEEQEDEVVLEVLQKGYKLKDRVIRAAQVKINQK